MGSKWMELLRECAPDIRFVTAVYNPETAPMTPLFFPSIEAVKSLVPVQLNRAPVRNDIELEKAIASAAERPNAGLIFCPIVTWRLGLRKCPFGCATQDIGRLIPFQPSHVAGG